MRSLGFSRVTRDDLERFAEWVVTSAGLLVPLLGSSSVGSAGLDARCCWCGWRLILYWLLGCCSTSINLCEASVRNGGVGDSF